MTYTGWIDDEPLDGSFTPGGKLPGVSPRTVATGAIVFAGLAAAALVAAWGVGLPPFARPQAASASIPTDALRPTPLLDAELVLAPRGKVTHISDFGSVGILAPSPGWLFDPASPVEPGPFVGAQVAEAERPLDVVETVKTVPLPSANPLFAGGLHGKEDGFGPTIQDPRTALSPVPLPQRNPLLSSRTQVADLPPAERPAEEAPPAVAPQSTTPELRNPPGASVPLPTPTDRYALYDILSQVVYMPDGEKLEAHSGYGDMFDDPRHIAVRMKGPTPPNTYDITLRSSLFHGVEALRLTPSGSGKMFGRDGFLVHSFMMGPRGDSNGCVSVKDYDKFLAAYKRGDVKRLVVVVGTPKPAQPSNPLLSWLASGSKAAN